MTTNASRLFIVSSRLPVRIEESGESIKIFSASGRLVASVSQYAATMTKMQYPGFSEVYWAGIPGCSTGTWSHARSRLRGTPYDFCPVFLQSKDNELLHNGFAGSILWPLFHDLPFHTNLSEIDYDHYLRVNREFADTMQRYIRQNDTIWIHDYHLLPLARMIRKKIPSITIGVYLHIPFPAYTVFCQLPRLWQEELLLGILGGDLIGFQTQEYADNFLQCIQFVLAIDSQDQSIRHEDRLIEIGSFPCSIDYPAFNEHSDTGGIKSLLENIRSAFGEKKIIFSIDGLDSTNGILLRLDAYRHFLLQNPGYREKVVFIQAIIPASDTTSSGNAGQKRIIDESITRLNEEAGTPDWQPLVYIYSRLEFDELLTLYRVSDLALITPLRDGMIPVAKEFVASRYDHRGTLILSTTAGSVKELQEALWADPFDIDGMAAMMRTALTMPLAEQEQRIRAMQQPLRDCNSGTWVDDYLSRLRTTKARQQNFQVRFFDIQSKNVLLDKYREAKNCLFLLDYDGTLTPFFQLPALAKPDNLLLDILGNIAANPRNAVYIISGRDSRTLESWLGHLPVNIIAEHGARLRYKGGQWEETATPAVKWKEIVAPLMERYVEKCRNSFVEIKDFSIAWHYRNAEPEQARVIGTELYADLLRQTSGMALQVMMGNKIIEVRNSGADKGNAIRKVLQREEQDLILSIGDDRTDEDMFRILADMEKAWTIKVGSEASFARFNLHTPQMVISLLGNLMYLEQQSTK